MCAKTATLSATEITYFMRKLKGGFRGKNLFFCLLSENECLDGMEPVYILVFFSETQTPSYTACYILYF